MRALGWFLAAILGTLVLAALLAWPVWQITHAIQPDWPFHKIVSRLWQLLLLIGLVVMTVNLLVDVLYVLINPRMRHVD